MCSNFSSPGLIWKNPGAVPTLSSLKANALPPSLSLRCERKSLRAIKSFWCCNRLDHFFSCHPLQNINSACASRCNPGTANRRNSWSCQTRWLSEFKNFLTFEGDPGISMMPDRCRSCVHSQGEKMQPSVWLCFSRRHQGVCLLKALRWGSLSSEQSNFSPSRPLLNETAHPRAPPPLPPTSQTLMWAWVCIQAHGLNSPLSKLNNFASEFMFLQPEFLLDFALASIFFFFCASVSTCFPKSSLQTHHAGSHRLLLKTCMTLYEFIFTTQSHSF